jgi:hypothetical protein
MDLPPSAFAMLEYAQRDNVFYAIRHGHQNISGYESLAEASPVSSEGETAFRNAVPWLSGAGCHGWAASALDQRAPTATSPKPPARATGWCCRC